MGKDKRALDESRLGDKAGEALKKYAEYPIDLPIRLTIVPLAGFPVFRVVPNQPFVSGAGNLFNIWVYPTENAPASVIGGIPAPNTDSAKNIDSEYRRIRNEVYQNDELAESALTVIDTIIVNHLAST